MSITTTNDKPSKVKEVSKNLPDELSKDSDKNITINTLQDLIDFIKKINTFINSEIIKCIINNINCDKLKYRTILNMIYEIINDPIKIMSRTKLNIKLIEDKEKGFYYIKKLGISVQGCDSNKCLLEIINQCIENNIMISMEIKLINSVVKLSFNNK